MATASNGMKLLHTGESASLFWPDLDGFLAEINSSFTGRHTAAKMRDGIEIRVGANCSLSNSCTLRTFCSSENSMDRPCKRQELEDGGDQQRLSNVDSDLTAELNTGRPAAGAAESSSCISSKGGYMHGAETVNDLRLHLCMSTFAPSEHTCGSKTDEIRVRSFQEQPEEMLSSRHISLEQVGEEEEELLQLRLGRSRECAENSSLRGATKTLQLFPVKKDGLISLKPSSSQANSLSLTAVLCPSFQSDLSTVSSSNTESSTDQSAERSRAVDCLKLFGASYCDSSFSSVPQSRAYSNSNPTHSCSPANRVVPSIISVPSPSFTACATETLENQPGYLESYCKSTNASIRSEAPVFKIIDKRKRSGIWLSLLPRSAKKNDGSCDSGAAAHDFGRLPYIRIKNGNVRISTVKRYLRWKLSLATTAKVDVACRGNVLQEGDTLRSVQDNIWKTQSSASFCNSPSEFVMLLSYDVSS